MVVVDLEYCMPCRDDGDDGPSSDLSPARRVRELEMKDGQGVRSLKRVRASASSRSELINNDTVH
jgi:hypothetical protein